MKILHVISTINPKAGGVSQALVTIIKQLCSKGIVNEVVSVDMGSAHYLNSYDFKIYALGPGKTSWSYSGELVKWLKANIQGYDSIIVHGLWQYQSVAVYNAYVNIQGNRPRLFVMPHGMLDPYFQKAKERRVKAIRNYVVWHLLENKLINVANALLFTCEDELLLARQTFKRYKPKKEIVVGLGVDAPPLFTMGMPTAFEAKLGAKISNYWLFISRIHEKKGVDLLIKAYQTLKNQGLELPKLVIAGPGLDTKYGKEMLALADSNQNIFFTGMLTGDAKWGAFYGAELFILPSHQENFGIAVVEALACRKPVLITNKVNIYREIINGKCGLVNNDDILGTVDSLKTWYNMSSAERILFSNNAFATFFTKFNTEATTDNFLKILEFSFK